MKKLSCFFLFIYVIINNCYAQNNISGYVFDKESGEALIGVRVFTDSYNRGTVTNNMGYFYMNIPPKDSITICFSFLGYQTVKKPLKQFQSKIKVHLERQEYSLGEVVVWNDDYAQSHPGNISLSMEQVRLIPGVSGEPDILKAFQSLPGVQQGEEGSVGLIVRGGSSDQNLYLLDDVPLYYINHLGGFASIFDVSVIKQSNLYKGFFPAAYGGRLSSILDVRLKDGDMYNSRKEFSIGTLTSKFFCEGPLKNNKTTYMLSARYCNLGWLTLLADDFYYTFYDFNTKISHRINENNRLYFTFYSGADLISTHHKDSYGVSGYSKYNTSYNFGDNMANIRWFHAFNPYCNSNTIVAFSKFYNSNSFQTKYEQNDIKNISKVKHNSSISDFLIKSNVDFLKFSNHKLKGGFVLSFQQFNPETTAYYQENDVAKLDSTIHHKTGGVQSAFYIEDDWSIHKNISLSAGLRYSNFSPGNNHFYHTTEPRLLAKFHIKDGSFYLGYSRMSQSIHLLSNNDFGVPKDLWVPSTQKVAPEQSGQFEAEASYSFLNNYKFTICAYYKKLSNLIELQTNLLATKKWEDVVETNGRGINKGVEFLIAKEKGRLTGYASYVLSKSTRQFEKINDGKEYPFKYDYPHQVNINVGYKLNDAIKFVASWVYHTGYAITMTNEKFLIAGGGNSYDGEYGEAHIYGEKNSYRMPSYHRLDVGINRKKGKGEWHYGIYNAYNRMNPYYYYVVSKEDGYVIKQKTIFPFLPSISYSYYF